MNRDDLAELIEQQIPRMRRYARALASDREEADDLVEACLELAWRRGNQWDPGQDLRIWLFSILHNLNASRVKAFRPSNNAATEAGLRLTTNAQPAIGAGLGAIENGLAQLPEEHHEVLLLVCIEEMNYEQVAGVLGVRVGTVISRLHRAREHLRHWMNREKGPSLRRVK